MSSTLPKISALREAPSANRQYAEILLNLLVTAFFSMDEIYIGLFENNDEKGSAISFDADEFENVQLQLQYSGNRFLLILYENSNENCACTFSYKIFDNTDLYQRIPEKIRDAMEEVAYKIKSAILKRDSDCNKDN
jgi:hypothetical protein